MGHLRESLPLPNLGAEVRSQSPIRTPGSLQMSDDERSAVGDVEDEEPDRDGGEL